MSEGQPITCPCCGYKTITTEFDICEICGWEHNFYQEDNSEDDGGPNFGLVPGSATEFCTIWRKVGSKLEAQQKAYSRGRTRSELEAYRLTRLVRHAANDFR